MENANKLRELYSNEVYSKMKKYSKESKPTSLPFTNIFEKLKNNYRDKINKLSDKLVIFIEKNKTKLEKIENFLELSFLLYGYSAFLDYLSSWSVCESVSDEVNPFYRKLFENYGIDKGHLLACLWDVAVFGAFYETSKYLDKIAKKIDSRIESLPLFRKTLPYVYAISCGIAHYLAYKNNW